MPIKKIIILIIIIFMGLYFNIALFFPYDKIDGKEIEAKVIILEKNNFDKNYESYLVKLVEIKNCKQIKNVNFYININEENNFFPGQVLIIRGTYERGEISRNYKGFNYRKYLLQKRVYGIVKVTEYIKKENENNFNIFIYKFKNKIIDIISKTYDDLEIKDFLKCILVGKSIDDDLLKENFRNSNLSHILAISGMHVSYIMLGISIIKIKPKKFMYILELIILNFYLLLTGISVSCMRACLMNSLLIISKFFYRKNNIYITLIYTFIFCNLFNIYNLENAGMWLSFGGTLGIIIFSKFIYKILLFKIKKIFLIKNKLYKIIEKIIEIISVCISAQIMILPIMIYYFNSISLNFIISNLFTSFLIGPIIILGYIVIIFNLLKLNFCIDIFKFIETLFVKTLIFLVNLIGNNLKLNINIITPNIFSVFFYYFILISSLSYFKKGNNVKILKNIYGFFSLRDFKEKNKNNLKINIKKIIKNKKNIFLFFLLLIFFIFININYNFFHNLKIYFVDVGQGDCTFIVTQNNKTILIDGGEGNSEKYDYGKNVLYPYLLDRKITHIDYIFISHFDSDHVRAVYYT